MALATYQQLQDTMGAFLWYREDLNGRFPDFITMAEADFNSKFRLRAMETSATITLTSGEGALPSDYLAWRRVITQDNPVRVLDYATPDWVLEQFPTAIATLGCYFTIIGDTIKTYPQSSSNLTMHYYQKIPALSTNTTGNWLLTRAPNVYLYGSLLHSAPFLDDDQRIQTWMQLRDQAATLLISSDATERYAKVVSRITGATP